MPAERLNSIRCHSTNTVRAQQRFASNHRRYLHLPTSTCKPQTISQRQLSSLHGSGNISCAFKSKAFSSAVAFSSSRSARTRVRGWDFTTPEAKPKFRVRTPEENEEFIRVLKETQEQYEAGSKRAEDVEVVSLSDDNNGKADTFKLSFFAVSDTRPQEQARRDRSQPGSNQPVVMHPTFPKRTQVPRDEASTIELENELHYLSHNDPRPIAIHRILKILVQDRKIKPKTQYYEAQILTNVSPEWGSVKNMRKIMTEMEVEGIKIDASIIAAILKVLAVRPSPELSHTLLDMVQRQWIQLPPQTTHHLILALIRTGQTELAAWTLDMLRTTNKSLKSRDREIIPDYLVVLLITELVRLKDWEGVLRYIYKLRNRRAADREIPVHFWGWLLVRASSAAREVTEAVSQPSNSLGQPHESTPSPSLISPTASNIRLQTDLSNPAYHLTQILWTYYAANMSLRPTWATCVNILHSAANTGNPHLAASVLATMTYRNGIDTHGRPQTTIPEEVHALVHRAQTKAQQLEAEKLAAETPDERTARLTSEHLAAETKRKDEELDRWYDELFKQFEAEKLDSTSPDEKRAPRPTPNSQKDTLNSAAYEPFDSSTVPHGNLWPLFPEFAGAKSAYVDAWEALGPRSSTRRRWTEAQEHYKRVARAMGKRY